MITPVLPTYARVALRFERGEGSYLYTEDGEQYLDFGAGIAVNALGHAHPRLVAALTGQAEKMWHCSNLYQIPAQEKLARRLTEQTFADTVFFTNSGAEAVECAIKMARKYHDTGTETPQRFELITFEGAFHGRTLATLAAGGQEKYLQGFGPRVEGFTQVRYGDMAALERAIGPQTAGIMLEPVQGESGVRPFEREDLRTIRRLCDEAGILMVLDEVQTGIGRTGFLFAHEAAEVRPDIVASAKGLGGGFPVGACLATEEAARGMTTGTHGSTFGGNPLAACVANAVLDVVLEEGFLEAVADKGRLLKQKLAQVCDEYPQVIETIRGEGLLMGMKCRTAQKEMMDALYAENLLCVGAGDNVIRLVPPLIVSPAEIDEATDRIARACRRVEALPGKRQERTGS